MDESSVSHFFSSALTHDLLFQKLGWPCFHIDVEFEPSVIEHTTRAPVFAPWILSPNISRKVFLPPVT